MANRPLYTVTALLEVPEITLEELRQVQPFLWDQRWVARSFSNPDAAAGDSTGHLHQRALKPEYWRGALHYRAALNRDDVRDIPAEQFQKSGGLGLEFTLRVSSEEQASTTLDALTKHVRGAFLANSLIDLTRKSQAELTERPQLNLDILKADFEIEQNHRRIADMQAVLERYPQLRSLETVTLFSVSDGGGKYLSPLPQIVALETTVSELQAKARLSRHELDRLDAIAQLMADMDWAIRHASAGSDLLDQLSKNREQLLSVQTPPSAAVREALERVDLKLNHIVSRHQAIGLKTRSAVSASPVAARNPLIVGLASFAVTLIGLSVLLAIHVLLRKDRPVLPWLPHRLRRWLIVEVAT
ncbi:hypothetical protein OU997_07590 [Pseudomonas sp. SL4(2022)]|uniref:hypothetical protein n=1 Tax=unclassified Pseudomonas TaxID=196821 RepID=UPI0011B24D69|nr:MULTISPECIES: hypothetical protein [unclassified Pseudomonas]WAC46011.1 hypothetical protein OU997_07590 [Pseudomonas sp. SL4(2022)]